MKIAWFTARDTAPDDTASLVAELRHRHDITVIDERGAHAFVWQHARNAFDLQVYELSDTPAAAFMWPYLLHYPGIVRLHDGSLRTSRTRALLGSARIADYERELRFSGTGMLRAPLLASRAVVVTGEEFAAALGSEYPQLRIFLVPPGAEAPDTPLPDTPVTVGFVDGTMEDTIGRAAMRARESGAHFELRRFPSAADAVRTAHVLLAMQWPPLAGPPPAAIVAMSAARAVVVHEAAATAVWPALDPQTWEPRGLVGGAAPIVVSIDPRDEEHSLMLAIRRLAADAGFRRRLGRAAHAWWRAHATPGTAAAAWENVFRGASTLAPPGRPADWPVHLSADGTQRGRALLRDFGVPVDVLD